MQIPITRPIWPSIVKSLALLLTAFVMVRYVLPALYERPFHPLVGFGLSMVSVARFNAVCTTTTTKNPTNQRTDCVLHFDGRSVSRAATLDKEVFNMARARAEQDSFSI